MTGAYRKIIVRPESPTWQVIRHSTDTDNLIRSDLEELKGEQAVESTEDGALRSLLVQFQLPSSTYATMVLREILKADTSSAHQTKLGLEQQQRLLEKQNEAKESTETASEDGEPKIKGETLKRTRNNKNEEVVDEEDNKKLKVEDE